MVIGAVCACQISKLFLRSCEGIFGQHLEDTLKYEQEREPDRQVPEIVQMCVEFLYSNGLEIHGLFRFFRHLDMLYCNNATVAL